MVRLPSLKTIFIVSLGVWFLSAQWGCATQPYTLPAEVRESLGTIGVVSARYTPAVEFELPAKGWLGGAGRGAVGGTKAFVVLVPSAAVIAGLSVGLMVLPPTAPYGVGGALYATAELVKGAGYMIAGPFYGATAAEASAKVEESETQLKAALVSMRIQETMRDHVVQAAGVANVNLTVVDGQGPENASDLLTYLPLQESQIDSVLELRVNRVWLSVTESFFKSIHIDIKNPKPKPSQDLRINPSLSLGMELRSRLIRTTDKVVLYDNTWKREGGSHVFAEWAANDAQLFSKEFERAYHELAHQLVTGMF